MKFKWSPYFWVCFAMCIGVMSTALISPLYPIYKQAWGLQPSAISVIYVVYMLGALFSLVFLGQLPDRLGFHRVMQLALGLVLLGTVLTIFSWDMLSLNVARFIVGVSSSMMTTAAAIGLTRLAPEGKLQRAVTMTGVLIAFGFGIGPLVGGIAGQWAPSPMVTTYLPTILLGCLSMYALRRISVPEHALVAGNRPSTGWRQWLPRLEWPKSDNIAFALTTCCPFLAFAVFGLYASMSPLFLDMVVPWHGPFVSGTAIAVILLISAVLQLVVGSMSARWCGLFGLLALALSNALLLINLHIGSGLLFGLGIVLTAAGHGMSMLAGMNMVARIAEPHNHGALLASYLVVGYIGSMLPMLGIGWIADRWGLSLAVMMFCSGAMVISLATGLAFFRHPRMRT